MCDFRPIQEAGIMGLTAQTQEGRKTWAQRLKWLLGGRRWHLLLVSHTWALQCPDSEAQLRLP